jgi:hypothetical protein
VNARATAAVAKTLEFLDQVSRDEGLHFSGSITDGALRVYFDVDADGEHFIRGAAQ